MARGRIRENIGSVADCRNHDRFVRRADGESSKTQRGKKGLCGRQPGRLSAHATLAAIAAHSAANGVHAAANDASERRTTCPRQTPPPGWASQSAGTAQVPVVRQVAASSAGSIGSLRTRLPVAA